MPLMARGPLLDAAFYTRDQEAVAQELLGKRLIRRVGSQVLEGVIVETEAYYGREDPASRAYHGRKNYNQLMWDAPGRVFIYNVHKYWMLNIVAHAPNQVGAVLIRALEPQEGIEVMQRNRSATRLVNLTNGPGKLTTALQIDRSVNGDLVTSCESTLFVAESGMNPEVGRSHRIGVRRDLERTLRFFIQGNPYVSRR
jgi:DNA-3-methyladenine glycosylase